MYNDIVLFYLSYKFERIPHLHMIRGNYTKLQKELQIFGITLCPKKGLIHAPSVSPNCAVPSFSLD
jgi:hypothetical protein